jgi:hypothetical protein
MFALTDELALPDLPGRLASAPTGRSILFACVSRSGALRSGRSSLSGKGFFRRQDAPDRLPARATEACSILRAAGFRMRSSDGRGSAADPGCANLVPPPSSIRGEFPGDLLRVALHRHDQELARSFRVVSRRIDEVPEDVVFGIAGYLERARCRCQRDLPRRGSGLPARSFGLMRLSRRQPRRFGGGAERSRTADLLNAIQALSQLSYGPTPRRSVRAARRRRSRQNPAP